MEKKAYRKKVRRGVLVPLSPPYVIFFALTIFAAAVMEDRCLLVLGYRFAHRCLHLAHINDYRFLFFHANTVSIRTGRLPLATSLVDFWQQPQSRNATATEW